VKPSRPAPQYPNIVFVVLDTARADALEPYGAPAGSSPALAQLAASGTAACNVFSTANWTFPSHVSMLSGLLPRGSGLVRVVEDTADRMADLSPRLLPSVLSGAGYATKAVSANPWIHPRNGFANGFDEFVPVQGTHRHSGFNWGAGAGPQGSRARHLAQAVPRAVEAARARADHGAAEALAVVSRWMADLDRTRPFFWFVNLLECHSPYAPPRRFARLGPADRVRAAFDHEHVSGLQSLWAINSGARAVSPDRIERMRRAYPGGVRAADAWVGRLLECLDDGGVLDDTLLIVTSDHGENLGESGRIAHALWLDDRLIRVPLIVAGPVTLGLDGATSIASLPRLIAEAAGLDHHPWQQPDVPAGFGIAQFDPPVRVTDAAFPDLRDRLGLDDYAVWRLTTPSTCATDGTLKLVVEGEEEWLYDLSADPGEVAPLHLDGRSARAYADRLPPLRAAAKAARAEGSVAPRSVATTVQAMPTDDAMEQRLRLLGYL
jgi:arylsulfatase A-like enzyme